jgi:uncharacterized protein
VSTTFHVLAVLFLATFIRSALGFGEALVAVPLLALVMPVQVAAPLAVLVSIAVAAIVVIQDWREVHIRGAGWLALSTLFGIPLVAIVAGHVVHRRLSGPRFLMCVHAGLAFIGALLLEQALHA